MKLTLAVSLSVLIVTAAVAAPARPWLRIDAAVLNQLETVLRPIAGTLNTIDVSTLDLKYSDGKNVEISLAALKQNIGSTIKLIGIVKNQQNISTVVLLFSLDFEVRIGLRDLDQELEVSGNHSESAQSIRTALLVFQLQRPLEQQSSKLGSAVEAFADATGRALAECP
jgi:hypothetical protein